MGSNTKLSARAHGAGSLILVEAGAARLADCIVKVSDETVDETVIIAQAPGEAAIDFAHRVLHRIAASERAARAFRRASLCTTATLDSKARSARRLVALGLMAHAEAAGALDALIIYAPADASSAERQALVELADDLALAAERKPLPLRLRLVEPADVTSDEDRESETTPAAFPHGFPPEAARGQDRMELRQS
jgi:hypothetical protein